MDGQNTSTGSAEYDKRVKLHLKTKFGLFGAVHKNEMNPKITLFDLGVQIDPPPPPPIGRKKFYF